MAPSWPSWKLSQLQRFGSRALHGDWLPSGCQQLVHAFKAKAATPIQSRLPGSKRAAIAVTQYLVATGVALDGRPQADERHGGEKAANQKRLHLTGSTLSA
jgi:hypothetical protein